MAEEPNLRRLVGLTPDEQEAMRRAAGRRVVSVEHEMLDAGEALLIVFEGGEALAVEAAVQLDLTHLSPLAVSVVRMQWSNPAPADGVPYFKIERGGLSLRADEPPSYVVERHGATHSWTREELRGWRRLKGPWYRLRGWWGF